MKAGASVALHVNVMEAVCEKLEREPESFTLEGSGEHALELIAQDQRGRGRGLEHVDSFWHGRDTTKKEGRGCAPQTLGNPYFGRGATPSTSA